MKEKNKKEMRKKRESIFIIANLLISILAIAFMIGLESERVSGDGAEEHEINKGMKFTIGDLNYEVTGVNKQEEKIIYRVTRGSNDPDPYTTTVPENYFRQTFGSHFDTPPTASPTSTKKSPSVAPVAAQAGTGVSVGSDFEVDKPSGLVNRFEDQDPTEGLDSAAGAASSAQFIPKVIGKGTTLSGTTLTEISGIKGLAGKEILVAKGGSLTIGEKTVTGITKIIPQEGGKFTVIGKGGSFEGVSAEELSKANLQLKGDLKTGELTAAGSEGNYGKLAKILGIKNPVMGNLVQGLQWAAVAYFAIPFIGDLLGLEPETTKALQYAVSSGLFAYNAAEALQASSLLEGNSGFFASSSFPAIAGIGIGIVVFILTYKKVEYKTISFTCLPWEAPVGGNDCEKCNDEIQTCSRYRCKSLGQACELLNEGTNEEKCYWANPKDVSSPMITPNESVLTDGYEYTNTKPRPPSWGTFIVKTRSKDGCIAAFTPISFGINTNKPSQCKIDFNKTATYDDMQFYFGESNLYGYSHTQNLNLPSPEAINSYAASTNQSETGGLTIQNDGRYKLYARCRSGNGFWNIDPYEIQFCVDKGPDTQAPQILETSIRNNQPVQFEVDKVPIVVYTNEPANCRWSRTNLIFDKMENNMSCANNPMQMQSNLLYACSGELTNIEDRKDNTYYFKCEDQPWKPKNERNKMTSSHILTLKGTQPLNIVKNSVKPSNETITGATTTIPINLTLETEHGYKDGEATCYYSVNTGDNYIEMLNTNTFKHSQQQDLTAGTYTYYFKCIDLGGNQDTTNTTFTIFVDTKEPNVVRVLFDNDKLKIQTDEDADCYYTNNDNTKCNYELTNEGINLMPHETNNNKKEHFAPWDLKETYYIKCKDVNGKQPSPTQCSITVRPTEINVE